LCDKVDAGPSQLQPNSEILFFAKAPGAQLKTHRFRRSPRRVTPLSDGSEFFASRRGYSRRSAVTDRRYSFAAGTITERLHAS